MNYPQNEIGSRIKKTHTYTSNTGLPTQASPRLNEKTHHSNQLWLRVFLDHFHAGEACSFAPMRLELVGFSHGKWHLAQRKIGDMLDENKKLE